MKKYLITSLVSLTLSVSIIIHLYKTKDIEWVDAVVESASEALGVVVEKTYRKKQESKIADPNLVTELKVPVVDTAQVSPTEERDSLVESQPLPLKEKKERLFNVEIAAKLESPITEKVDSVVVVPTTVLPKRALFNSGVDRTESAKVVKEEPTRVVFFRAEVNQRQKFNDDEEIVFRTSEPVSIGNLVIPERVVFYAKANIFDGRIRFIVKSINDVAIQGENYFEQSQGMPIRSEFRLDGSYFLSEGFPVTFGVRL